MSDLFDPKTIDAAVAYSKTLTFHPTRLTYCDSCVNPQRETVRSIRKYHCDACGENAAINVTDIERQFD
jgi:uncharacterized protein YlaI